MKDSKIEFYVMYIDLDLKPGMDHDHRRLAYEDLQEVIVHESGDNYWVVDEFRMVDGINRLVYVLCESDDASLLMVDHEDGVALIVYPKSISFISSVSPFADRLSHLLHDQYHYSLRRAGLYSSLDYEPRNKHLQIIKGGLSGDSDISVQ